MDVTNTRVKFVGVDTSGWSVYQDLQHTRKMIDEMPDARVTKNPFAADVYWFVWYNQMHSLRHRWPRWMKSAFSKPIVANITNDIRDNQASFRPLREMVDCWVSPNSQISEILSREKLPFVELPFFVPPTSFYPLEQTREELAALAGVDAEVIQGKVLIGSFQRDSQGNDLSSARWQKDPDFLLSVVEQLPRDRFLLLLAGPRRHYVIRECRKRNIPYLYVGNEKFIDTMSDDAKHNTLSYEQLNQLYNLVDVYLVTSKSEGGPKAVIECALTKTPISSTDVGLARDFLTPDQIINNPTSMVELVLALKPGEVRGLHQKHIDANYKVAMKKMSADYYKEQFARAISIARSVDKSV